MVNKHMKRCLLLSAIRETQIVTTMSYHYAPIRMARIKNSDNTKSWPGRAKAGPLPHCECRMIQLLWEKSLAVPFKKKHALLRGPAIAHRGMHPREIRACVHTKAGP